MRDIEKARGVEAQFIPENPAGSYDHRLLLVGTRPQRVRNRRKACRTPTSARG